METIAHQPNCACGLCADNRRQAALLAAKELPSARRSAADCSAATALAAYFDSQYPAVIDHAGRAEKLEDGTWHFCLHPNGVNGDTIDLWINQKGITLTKQNARVLAQPTKTSTNQSDAK